MFHMPFVVLWSCGVGKSIFLIKEQDFNNSHQRLTQFNHNCNALHFLRTMECGSMWMLHMLVVHVYVQNTATTLMVLKKPTHLTWMHINGFSQTLIVRCSGSRYVIFLVARIVYLFAITLLFLQVCPTAPLCKNQMHHFMKDSTWYKT